MNAKCSGSEPQGGPQTAAIALTASAPLAAEAKTTEYLDKRIFDSTPPSPPERGTWTG